MRNIDFKYSVFLEIEVIRNDRQREIKQRMNANTPSSLGSLQVSVTVFGSVHSYPGVLSLLGGFQTLEALRPGGNPVCFKYGGNGGGCVFKVVVKQQWVLLIFSSSYFLVQLVCGCYTGKPAFHF